MLAAALLHECGHLAAIRLAGAPVLRVDVDVLSACIVYADARVPPRTEVCIALSGPLFNLLGALAGTLAEDARIGYVADGHYWTQQFIG